MLALIAAVLVSREGFGKDPVFIALMKVRGLDYRDNPVTQTLRRVGVASVMERRLETLPELADQESIKKALEKEPRWVLLIAGQEPVSLMPAADLARHMQTNETEGPVNLHEIPAVRQDVTAIDFQATLQEALEMLNSSEVESLYVTRRTIPGINRIYGIITRNDIDQYYTVQ